MAALPASTVTADVVVLNDSQACTSTEQAATANSVRAVSEAKVWRAGDTIVGDLAVTGTTTLGPFVANATGLHATTRQVLCSDGSLQLQKDGALDLERMMRLSFVVSAGSGSPATPLTVAAPALSYVW